MTEYFDFCFGAEKAGYQVYERQPDRIAWYTRFRLDDEEIETSHEVELADGRVTRFRADEGNWIDASGYPNDAMPTAGVTLLLERMDAEGLDVLDYLAVDESTGEMLGPTRLRRQGGLALRIGLMARRGASGLQMIRDRHRRDAHLRDPRDIGVR